MTTLRKKPVVTITTHAYKIQLAIKALKYQARTEAGLSQAPDLFQAEHTEWWEISEELAKLLGEQK